MLTVGAEASIKPKSIPTIDTSATQSVKSPTTRHPRTPRRPGQHVVRLEAVDDPLGPLGPLGDNAHAAVVDQPPAPPQKEQGLSLRQSSSSSAQSPLARSMLEDDDLERSLGPRIPPPVQPAQGTLPRRDTQPSVSIEQAAKPSFDITVGDPHKVGDLTSSHIVYLVKTKVRSSMAFCDFSLTRSRHHPKHTVNQSSLSHGDIETSSGCITRCMQTTQELLFRRLRRSKLLDDLTRTL